MPEAKTSPRAGHPNMEYYFLMVNIDQEPDTISEEKLRAFLRKLDRVVIEKDSLHKFRKFLNSRISFINAQSRPDHHVGLLFSPSLEMDTPRISFPGVESGLEKFSLEFFPAKPEDVKNRVWSSMPVASRLIQLNLFHL